MYYLLWIIAIGVLPWWITVILLMITGQMIAALVVLVIALLLEGRGL